MLKGAVTPYGVLNAGTVHNIPTKFACGWIAAGIAEQDKSLDGSQETK